MLNDEPQFKSEYEHVNLDLAFSTLWTGELKEVTIHIPSELAIDGRLYT